jgi:hypothetical protein
MRPLPGDKMVYYGPSENQKFAILIKPENFDLIAFMNLGTRLYWMDTGEYLGDYYTYTISKKSQQSIANRKIETPDELRAPYNKLNPEDRKIAYVSV